MIPLLIINDDGKQSIVERVMLQHTLLMLSMADDNPLQPPVILTPDGGISGLI